MEAIASQSLLSFSSNLCKRSIPGDADSNSCNVKAKGKFQIVSLAMLAPRKFIRRRKKMEVFKDAADEVRQRNWRRMMTEIEQSGSAVEVLRKQRSGVDALPKDVVLGTLVRFKQLKKWNIVSEILEWLRCQHWWDFTEMDFLMLITAYGKLGDFNKAEKILKYMNKKGYSASVISQTALMEAYGRAGQYNKAEAIFRRMQTSGPEPSPLTYQIILKTFVQGNKYKEAEAIFQNLLNDERSAFKPDQKMFHMMIYMYKKAGDYDQARRIFAQMADTGVPQSTVTFNSLMSFESNYKEVSSIYDQMQRAGLRPDVVSYALLIHAYGKARREDEALAVFEEMLDAGVRPTRKAYNILLDAFAVSGMVQEARTVFKSMRRDKCYPDLCSYATMLSAYVNACDMDGAEKFFQTLKQDGFQPTVVIYGTLMKGYAKANNIEKVMRVYERMRMRGVKPNQTIFTTIMDAYGKNSDFGSAVVWYKEMGIHGVLPDKKAKNILLSLANTPEEQQEARQLVGYACDNLMDPNASDLSAYSDNYLDNENNAESRLFEESQATLNHKKFNGSNFAEIDADDDLDNNGDDSDEYEDEEEGNEESLINIKDKEEILLANGLIDS